MRRILSVLVIFLGACVGDGDGIEPRPEPVQHVPEISSLKLSPDSALYMEGDGSVQITAEVSYTDLGQDIETLHVKMSDGISMTIPVAEMIDGISGTLSTPLTMTTSFKDGCTVEMWLVDKAGQGSNHVSVPFSVIRHMPEITNVTLSPDNAVLMEGDGSIVVTAEITFLDAGSDLQTLWVRMPDDTSIEFDEPTSTEMGTFSEDLTISTQTAGIFVFEFWLVDQAGDSSDPITAQIAVRREAQANDWTSRLSGVPHTLWDVVWNGNAFIAVGNGGAIFTSTDGINWAAVDSGTSFDLLAVAADGPHVIAVGLQIILQSNDNGVSWTVKDRPTEALLKAVAINASQVVVGGNRWGWGTAITMISEDRGDTWQAVDSWPDENLQISDLVYQDGMFVATTYSSLAATPGAWVTISSDGNVWSEIAVTDKDAVLDTISYGDSQFILGGLGGAVFTSPDGFNWIQLQTPVRDVLYTGAAWNGTRLVLTGMSMCGGDLWICDSPLDVPAGLSSTDGGVTWAVFDIDSDYASRGLTWGNGRFVSVGNKPRFSDEGAIYTAE